MVKPHTSDIRMTYENTRVTYRWHTGTYGWHMSTCEWNTYSKRLHMSDIRMSYKFIRVTCGWHTRTYEWHTNDIREHISDIQMTYEWHTSKYNWHTNDTQMAYELHANDIRNIKFYKGFGAFRSLFSKLFVVKTLIYAGANGFWSLGCFHSHTFYSNIPKFNYKVWEAE